MSEGISFGDVEHAQPQPGLRPDQDAHFSTAVVGEIADDELLIFVDLDVMRDMEAHALSNTRVELGGVMLGQQHIDDQGRPFVVITDSLRAEHYEATKGSFKFTHDTWSQITKQRDQFRPDLEMVGWYHTHPGWSVFLSGMDLFICNNFFNRPLDVALVIDPCEQDRGWFQWSEGPSPSTFRTKGFVLTTGRFRQQELDQFARIYNKEPMMNLDPRYGGGSMNNSQSPVVMMGNERKPLYDFAILAMLMTQFLFVSLLAWRMLGASGADQVSKLEQQVESMEEARLTSIREEAYRDILGAVVSKQTGNAGLAEKYTDLKVASQRMQANLEGQMALTEKLSEESALAASELKKVQVNSKRLERQLVERRSELEEAESEHEALLNRITENEDGTISVAPAGVPWLWAVLGGIVALLAGLAFGFSVGRKEGDMPSQQFEPNSDRPKSGFAPHPEQTEANGGDVNQDDVIKVVEE